MARAGNDAMREDRDGKLLEIVGQAEIAAVEKSAGLCGALQHQGAARADAESELIGVPRTIDDVERIVLQARIDFDVRDGLLHGEDFVHVGDGLQRLQRIVVCALAQDFFLSFVRRIAHLDAHQEAIELGFGERIRAVVLDRILCGNDKKRVGQRKRFAVDGDLRIVHRFEQRGLRARGGAVDFVGENDVGKDRALTEFKIARFGIVDADAEHVARQQVGRELDALETALKGLCKGLRECCFTDAGNIFDQQVSTREKGDERKLNGFFFSVDCAGNGATQF